MRTLGTKEAVENMIRILLNSGKQCPTEFWQATDLKGAEGNRMIEVCGLFARMKMSCGGDLTDLSILASETGADLPWAEDHFKERLAGPSNPGKQYLNWPYSPDFVDYLDASGEFSHTYQERFWPDKWKRFGAKFHKGDWNDVKDRLSSDITTRQAFLSIWHPEDQSNAGVRVPCTIGYWFKVTEGVLSITYLIRSCDARRHLRNDVYMTQRLAMEMVIHLRERGHSITLGNMDIWIGSLHCFHSDLYALKNKLK